MWHESDALAVLDKTDNNVIMVPERRAIVPQQLKSVEFEAPHLFLQWLAEPHANDAIWLDDFTLLHPWALVALAARATDPNSMLRVLSGSKSNAARFAHAIGFDALVEGKPPPVAQEATKTPVPLQAIAPFPTGFSQTEKIASAIVAHLFPHAQMDEEGAALTLRYVLVELLRNAVQHSLDPRGGIVFAQRMSGSDGGSLQIAVADRGIGIMAALAASHHDLVDAKVALHKALQPHVSGTFPPGDTGSQYNAGLGLYVTSEMAKKTASKLLVASRGATLLIKGDEEGAAHRQQELECEFAGTLVAFEMPVAYIDYESMLRDILAHVPSAGTTTGALAFDGAYPATATQILVHAVAENARAAEEYARETLHPRLFNQETLVLDMRRFDTMTQSFAHALLYQAIRLAWAVKNPIYIVNAKPSVRIALEFVEKYALR